MKRAIELSQTGMEGGYGGPFGVIIVKDNKIIGEGFNRVIKDQDPTAHAEIIAIRNACQKLGTHNLEGSILYTSCEPCPMCLGAIYWANIDKIYYASTRKDAADINFRDEFIYDEIKTSLEKRRKPIEQIKDLRQEAIDVFKSWQKKEDKVEY